MIKVTAIPTGKAWMKSAQKCGGKGRNGFQRKLDIFRDKNWVGPLEIFAWLVEHPEGKFIVDTGDRAENSTPGYLPWWNPFFTKQVSIRVAPHEEIGPRLCGLGLDPSTDIAAVILTHYITIIPAGCITSRTPASSAPAPAGRSRGDGREK